MGATKGLHRGIGGAHPAGVWSPCAGLYKTRLTKARLLWRQQFRERVAQFQPVKRLLQYQKTLVAVWQAVLVIAGRKDEGNAARGERVGDGVTVLPVEIDIEHRGVDGLRVEHRQSLIDAGGGADDRAA